MFIGVKLIGDTYVPAGEESTRVNTTDGTVRTFNLGVFLHGATITITIKQNFYTTDGTVRTLLWGVCFICNHHQSNRRVQSKKSYTTDGTVRTQLIGLDSWVNFVKPLRVSNCAN